MFGSRKTVEEKTVEEFLKSQDSEAVAHGGAEEREGAPKTAGWLIAGMVALLVMSLAAFVKISHLSREVALLKQQVAEKAGEGVTAGAGSLGARLAKSEGEVERLQNRLAGLERDVEAIRQADAKVKVSTRRGPADKKTRRL